MAAFFLVLTFAARACAVTEHHWNPDITPAVDGFFYVTWFNETDDNIQLQRINTAGITQWSNSVQVNTIGLTYPTGWQPEPQVAISGTNLYVLWGRGFQELRMMKMDSDGSPAWPAEVLVNSQPSETLGYDMAVDSDGYVYVHYQRYGPSGRASFLAKVDPDGGRVWADDVSSGQGGNQWDQRMAISDDDAIYTINAYRVDVSTVSTWLRRLNTGGTTVWYNVEVGLSEASVTTDGDNNVVVAGKSGNTVYMKRYDSNGSAIGSPAIVSTNASLPRCAGVVVDSDGSTYVTWEDKRSNYGYDYEVYARRFAANGTRLWSADVNVNAIDLADQQHSRIVRHPSGGTMVVWDQDTPGGGWLNILANRVDADGARSFSTDINLHEFGNPDVDGDDMADEWEAEYFGSSLDCEGSGDADGDGVSNYHEYIADTVPTNGASMFTVDMLGSVPPSVRFDSSAARSYSLESTPSLTSPITWTPVGDTETGTGGVMTLSDTEMPSRLYYRVKVRVP